MERTKVSEKVERLCEEFPLSHILSALSSYCNGWVAGGEPPYTPDERIMLQLRDILTEASEIAEEIEQ